MSGSEQPTTLITGATRGIGRAAARQLSERGHALVIAARDTERAQDLARGLPGRTDVYEVDLASLASVREFAAQVRARHHALAVLIKGKSPQSGAPISWKTCFSPSKTQ